MISGRSKGGMFSGVLANHIWLIIIFIFSKIVTLSVGTPLSFVKTSKCPSPQHFIFPIYL